MDPDVYELARSFSRTKDAMEEAMFALRRDRREREDPPSQTS